MTTVGEPVRLMAMNPGPMTGPGNNTWFLDGAEPTLIDAGVGHPEHVEELARALGGRPLARVLVTHGHSDHSGGVPALRARWPDVEVGAFTFDDRTGHRQLNDGDVVRAGDAELGVLHTPGHAEDHICLFEPASRALYTGDMVLAGSTVVIPASRGGDLRAYLLALERLAALKPSRIYPGHGDVIDDPVELIRAYLTHRRRREQQISRYLTEGLTTAEEIAARLYPNLPDALRAAARETVEAHLRKLRDDGRLG